MAIGSERLYISIVTDAAKAGRQLKGIGKDMKKTRTAAEAMRRSFVKLNSAFAIIGGATFFGRMVKDVIKVIDTYKELGGRLNLVVKETVGLSKAQDDLVKVAMRTYTAFDGVGALYAKMGLATKDLAIDHQTLLDITETVANTLRLSGASAQEAKSSMLQLSQAMASGVLAGDEYRSISENNVALLDLFSKASGKTRGELKKMAADQQITTEKMVEWISKFKGEYSAAVKSLPVTVGRAMSNLNTQWQQLLVGLEDSLGATDKLAKAMSYLANNLKEVVIQATAVFAVLTAAKLYAIAKGAAAAAGGVGSLTVALKASWGWASKLLPLLVGIAAWKGGGELHGMMNPEGTGVSASSLNSTKAMNAELVKQATLYAKLNKDGRDGNKILAAKHLHNVQELRNIIDLRSANKAAVAEKVEQMAIETAATDKLFAAEEARLAGVKDFTMDLSGGGGGGGGGGRAVADATNSIRDAFKSLREELFPLVGLTNEYKENLAVITAAEQLAGGATAEHAAARAELTKQFEEQKSELSEWGSIAKDAFQSFSDGFSTYIIDSIADGEASFADFVESVLKGIAKMAVQMAMTKFLGPMFGFADGGVIGAGSGTRMLAKGGVINQPTLLAGGAAIGGEAGAEVVAPLKRGRDGRMGVASAPSTINITTNNATVETEETVAEDGSRTLEIYVKGLMAKSLGDGSMDRIMRSNYGTPRRAFG